MIKFDILIVHCIKRLQRPTIEDLLLQLPHLAAPALAEVAEDVLCGLGLAGPRLARHDDALALLEHLHVPERLVRWKIVRGEPQEWTNYKKI